ncbi:WG repeat-containing protein [Oscillatoria amoena NRMC-F 0135]|nr:WG repeat-containing protein [Oscillatoria amoena NRMC-F 0135]
MKQQLVIIILCLAGIAIGRAQPSFERMAYSNIEKGKWAKARTQAQKAMRKDSVNALAHYIFALYYFKPGNPDFNIDSAYRYTMQSLSDLPFASARQRDRMRRFPADSSIIIKHRERIDSAAFQRAKAINTEQAYIDFLSAFPMAAQQPFAVELRDEVAYIDALKENTYKSFRAYLDKYPASVRAPEANARYQKLLFEAETRDKKLASYEKFLGVYPETPYRKEAELQVFEIMTAPGSRKSFEEFLRKYSQSAFAPKARNILYYILKESGEPIPSWLLTDSLRKVRMLEQSYLVPIYREGKLGFMDAHGKDVIAPFADELSKDYLCGNVVEDVLISSAGIVARNGKIIFEGKLEDAEDLGWGFLKVTHSGCVSVIHKSGFLSQAGCLADAAIVGGGRLLALKENGRWNITTLVGRLLHSGADEVINFDEVLAVRSSNVYRLCRADELSKVADQGAPVFSRNYQEVKRWKDALWVRSGELQGLLDDHLREVIALQKQEITPAFFGAIVLSSEGTRIWQKGRPISPVFTRLKISEPWITVEQSNTWYLFDKSGAGVGGKGYDSVYFIGPVLTGSYADTLVVHFEPFNFIKLPRTAKVTFLPGKDSVFYIMAEQGSTKTIYNSKGHRLFSTDVDRLAYAGENYFTATKNEKRGILTAQGRVVLPPEFDGLGNLNQGTLPVLKDKKFGMADLNLRRQIKPEYEKNIVRYNFNYLIASKGNAFGLIGWDNKPVLPFEYEEIRFWNDSTALVKKDFQWMLYNFVEKKKVVDRIRGFNWILDTETGKSLIIRQDNHYGVIHSRKGYILPATYTDIINLGSVTQPLYFTEKYVEEASIYVVIYYDSNGKLLRRQVFEADDYDKIYCSHN